MAVGWMTEIAGGVKKRFPPPRLDRHLPSRRLLPQREKPFCRFSAGFGQLDFRRGRGSVLRWCRVSEQYANM